MSTLPSYFTIDIPSLRVPSSWDSLYLTSAFIDLIQFSWHPTRPAACFSTRGIFSHQDSISGRLAMVEWVEWASQQLLSCVIKSEMNTTIGNTDLEFKSRGQLGARKHNSWGSSKRTLFSKHHNQTTTLAIRSRRNRLGPTTFVVAARALCTHKLYKEQFLIIISYLSLITPMYWPPSVHLTPVLSSLCHVKPPGASSTILNPSDLSVHNPCWLYLTQLFVKR